MPEHDPARLMRLITEEIWNRRRLELVDELISEDLVDHVDIPGLEGTGRARYLASVNANHSGFSDRREEIELIVADGDKAVSYALDHWDPRRRFHGDPTHGSHGGLPRDGDPPVRQRSGGRTMGCRRQSDDAATTGVARLTDRVTGLPVEQAIPTESREPHRSGRR